MASLAEQAAIPARNFRTLRPQARSSFASGTGRAGVAVRLTEISRR